MVALLNALSRGLRISSRQYAQQRNMKLGEQICTGLDRHIELLGNTVLCSKFWSPDQFKVVFFALWLIILRIFRTANSWSVLLQMRFYFLIPAMMKVTRDFFSYSSGIYRCPRQYGDDRSAYHSVRIVGWGEETQNSQLVKYWVITVFMSCMIV